MARKRKDSPPRDLDSEKFLRPQEVARMLGVHERTVWRLLIAKKLPGCKLGRGWIISRPMLNAYIEGLIKERMKS